MSAPTPLCRDCLYYKHDTHEPTCMHREAAFVNSRGQSGTAWMRFSKNGPCGTEGKLYTQRGVKAWWRFWE